MQRTFCPTDRGILPPVWLSPTCGWTDSNEWFVDILWFFGYNIVKMIIQIKRNEEKTMKPINEKISALRKERGLTQEQLGAKLGVSGQAVSKWECGESLPDILLLPDLCKLLNTSADSLLDVSQPENEPIMERFLAFMRANGCTETLLDALSRSFNSVGKSQGGNYCVYGDVIRGYDERGMGFLMSVNGWREVCTQLSHEDVTYFLSVLTDKAAFEVLKAILNGKAADRQMICTETGLDKQTVSEALLLLTGHGIILYERDEGYYPSACIVGIYMALSGCISVTEDGQPNGFYWFSALNERR